VGCAAFISIDNMPVAQKNWHSLEMKQISTWRELLVSVLSLKGFVYLLSGSAVKWSTNNQAVPWIVESGSMKEHLPQLVVDVFYTARENIEIDVQWIPRLLNERADYLSKIVDYDDWIVKDCYLRAVTSLWGPCSVDCFACSISRKVRRFYSKYFNPDSLGVDSLTFNWVGETCWLVPPVSLVKEVMRHVSFC